MRRRRWRRSRLPQRDRAHQPAAANGIARKIALRRENSQVCGGTSDPAFQSARPRRKPPSSAPQTRRPSHRP
jgi:hypothetical protein